MRGWGEGRDEDRLPWLETIEPDHQSSSGLGRVVIVAVIALLAMAAIGLGLWRWQSGGQTGNGELIAAPAGDYKVRPDEAGGMQAKGEGDAAIATSAGKGANDGAIDLNAVPERPVLASQPVSPAAAPTAAAGRSAVAEVPRTGGRLVAAAPMTASRPAAKGRSGGGSQVQLGAYPSEAVANDMWKRFSERFTYLTPLAKSVQPVATNGRTLYRLRVDASGAAQAADICGRLKVAGESCFVAG